MATFGSRNLKKGSTGSDVRELQTKLNTMGYNCGKVDGIFGTNTLAGVKRFQQAYGLAVDGIVGKNTFAQINYAWTKLMTPVKSPSSGSSSPSVSKPITTTSNVTTVKSNTSTVTLTSGEAPSVAKDELRIGIQTKPKTTSVTKADVSKKDSGNVSTVVTESTTVDTTTTQIYYPPIEGDVTWDTERAGSPGKLTFNMRANIVVSEGDIVSVTYGDTKVFMGYIFKLEHDKSGAVSVTAYDQLRYFKNLDTYVFENIKASAILKRIADDYGMKVGTIEDTAIVIPSVVEDDQSLFDIVGNALDKTVASGNKVFVMYDDYGKISLKSLDSMRVNLLLCEDTCGDYSYSSSIDDETYNQIVLYHDDDETKQRQYFTASSSSTIKQWGLLRKTESIDATEGAQSLANLYLALYNKKVRKLSISDAFGRPDVRAGALVPVIMKVGDVSLRNYMLVEKASHTWSNGKYFMNLDLSGAGDFSV